MGYKRLERDKVKAKIHKDYMKAKLKFERLRPKKDDIPRNHQEAIIHAIEQNPKSTSTEFARGIYQVLYYEARYLWTKDKNEIRKNPQFPDEHIIGVDELIKDVSTGKVYRVTFEQLAKGQEAIDRADTFNRHIEGFQEKQKDLNDKGTDKDLPRRLNRLKKMREKIVNG